ncbi:ComF family protein [Peptoclostridium acidaminophilum]|uniref:ComF family protein n=1 Tax=Peptoclostridium acidaminophilum TaxID=1731 RepID=UPI0004B2088A|nr:ComF family protein [Peptoclostridium acidaminophilum]
MENTYSLCRECFCAAKFIKKGCEICGKPLPEIYHEQRCPDCEEAQYCFERALCCMEYTDEVHRLIYSLKYGGRTYMAGSLARIMADKLEYEGVLCELCDMIVPVPLSKSRLRRRGFNQAGLIAEELSRLTGWPHIDAAERLRDTRFLSGLSRHERRSELSGVFRLKSEYKEQIEGKKILIVDDIFTTGATASELALVLKGEGAASVYAICLATGRNIY